MPSSTPTPPPPGRPEQRSTRVAFFIVGFATGAWAPLVPFARNRLALDDGALGLLLLCVGAGSIVAMPPAGALAAHFGCRRVLVAFSLLFCLALPLLAAASSVPLLVAALFVFGAGVGSVDCVMNIQAIIVERASGRAMMSGFHGLYSLGGIAGAGGMTALLGGRVSPLAAVLCLAGMILGALLLAAPRFLPYGSAREGPAFAVPHGVVLLIGALCFVMFLTEGTALDWSAVFLTKVRGLDPAWAGLGYTAFSLTMTAGRLTGDAVVRILGGSRVILLGGLCAAVGMLVVTLSPAWGAALFGYGLVGAGCANIVPVLFSAVGRQSAMPENVAVPAITTLGYAGILAGPAAIGFISRATSLPAAFLLLAAGLAVVALGGSRLRV